MENDLTHNEYCLALRILQKAETSPNCRRINLNILKSDPVAHILIAAGFKSLNMQCLQLEDLADFRKDILHQVQAKVDATLNPDTISFAQVADILKRDGTLPGIDCTMDDVPLESWDQVEEMKPPKKPWLTD